MVRFEPARGQKDFPFSSKGGYFAINLFPCKIICFLQSEENQSIQAVLQCCNASEHNEDGILVERWKKEYDVDEVMNVLVSKLRCVSVDALEEPCFVVEDKPGIIEQLGTNVRQMSNGVTLVKTREKAWPKAFY